VPQFLIEGQIRDFIPVKDFRAAHGLPPAFGVAWFEPKDYAGLGRIDHAGAELNAVRQTVLAAIPARMPLQGWMGFLPQLVALFERSLYDINAQVGLKDVEIEFAVAGFGDVCQALLYAMLRGNADFRQVYAEWLNSSIRLYGQPYDYEHEGQTWRHRRRDPLRIRPGAGLPRRRLYGGAAVRSRGAYPGSAGDLNRRGFVQEYSANLATWRFKNSFPHRNPHHHGNV
jgi:hypothetical protein